MREVTARIRPEVTEFTVAPQVNPDPGPALPRVAGRIQRSPEDPAAFAAALDEALLRRNAYYRDLIDGKVLRPLVLTPLAPGAFREYMKSRGKLGGQNKVPRPEQRPERGGWAGGRAGVVIALPPTHCPPLVGRFAPTGAGFLPCPLHS